MKNLNKQSWPALAAGLYAAAVLVWMPWHASGYVQLTQEKLSAFLGVTLLAGLLLAVVAPEKMGATRWKQQGKAAVLYAAATLVSVLLSGNIVAALWASGGYLGGLVLVAAALLGCMGTAVFLEDADSLALPFMVSGAGVTLLGIVNNFGADPLGFRAIIEPSQYNLFFSTIGNADYLSAYLCLWLPLALHRFAAGKSAGERTAGFRLGGAWSGGCGVPPAADCAADGGGTGPVCAVGGGLGRGTARYGRTLHPLAAAAHRAPLRRARPAAARGGNYRGLPGCGGALG